MKTNSSERNERLTVNFKNQIRAEKVRLSERLKDNTIVKKCIIEEYSNELNTDYYRGERLATEIRMGKVNINHLDIHDLNALDCFIKQAKELAILQEYNKVNLSSSKTELFIRDLVDFRKALNDVNVEDTLGEILTSNPKCFKSIGNCLNILELAKNYEETITRESNISAEDRAQITLSTFCNGLPLIKLMELYKDRLTKADLELIKNKALKAIEYLVNYNKSK